MNAPESSDAFARLVQRHRHDLAMDNSAFPLHSSIHLPSHSRILRQSCCPDKDLVVLFSRMGGLERITMYNYQNGTKIWDADVGDEASSTSTHVVDLCWSPDGASSFLQSSSRLIWSTQEGASHCCSIPLAFPCTQYKTDTLPFPCLLSYRREQGIHLHLRPPICPASGGSVPISWKSRQSSPISSNGTASSYDPPLIPHTCIQVRLQTGTTESILRSLPLLDPLAEESDKLTFEVSPS